MKHLPWKNTLLVVFVMIQLSLLYEFVLYDYHEEYKRSQTMKQIVLNYEEHEQEFQELIFYLKSLERDSILVPPSEEIIEEDPSTYTYHFFHEYTIGPDSPIYFGFGGPPAWEIDRRLKTLNCENIHYCSGSYHIHYRDLFDYIYTPSNLSTEIDWIELSNGFYFSDSPSY